MSEAPTAEEVGTPPAEDEEEPEAEGESEADDGDSETESPEEEAEAEPSLEDMSKDDLYEMAQKLDVEGRSKMDKDELIAAIRAAVAGEAAEAAAPVDELLPIIDVGHWVRFAAHKLVPAHLVGRDGVVLRALVKRAEGGDKIAPTPYSYQDGSEEFLVEARDTRETLTVTRDAFARFATDEVFLAAA